MIPVSFALLIPLAGMATGVVFMVGVYRLLTRWIDRKSLPEGDVARELARLRAETEGVHELRTRLEEVEERLDFAERLLAQHAHDRLPSRG